MISDPEEKSTKPVNRDLLCPGDPIRDPEGVIIAARGLIEATDMVPGAALGAVVWVTYSPPELTALGVPRDIVECAASSTTGPRTLYSLPRTSDEATPAEMAAWRLMQGLYRAHFGGPVGPRRGGRVERYDVAELAEALLVRPHRRAIASTAG